MDRAYLDHAATTPLDPRVLDAMLPVLRDGWGNPSGVYREAQKAHGLLDDARDAIAASLECSAREIILTSGGTESDNLAIRGVARSRSHAGRHLITSAIEHHAVLHPMEALADEGFEVTVLPVDAEGFVDPAAVAAAVRDDTILVSIMAANNEIGTLQPIAEISRAVKERNRRTVVHSDAVQAAGAIDIRPDILGVDLMSLTAHKIYGPKGIGLLYHRRRTPLEPTMLGGGQEEERRAGTENVASAAGLARALQLATDERDSRTATSGRSATPSGASSASASTRSASTAPPTGRAACPTTSTSASPASRARASCSSSTWKASPPAAAAPAAPAAPSPATSSPPSPSTPTPPTAPSASASAKPTPKPTSSS